MGNVYVLTNPAMPGLVKIGRTDRCVETRMKELNVTGLPFPYECASAWEFKDAAAVERALHRAFEDKRCGMSREFFKMDPDQVVVILETFGKKNVTPPVQAPDDVSHYTDVELKKKNFTFSGAQIGIGEELLSVWDDSIKCRVVGDKRVEFEGEEMTLSAAAKRVIQGRGKGWKTVSGPVSWAFKGETVAERRRRIEAGLKR